MPELPEVETVCRNLRAPLTGQAIASTLVLWPRTVIPLEPDTFAVQLAGLEIKGINRRAKLIVMHLSSGQFLTTHLRMTGKLLYSAPGAPGSDEPERHLRVAFELDDGSQLEFFDARKFGRMRLYDTAEWRAVSNDYGPEPLGSDFSSDWLYENLRRTRRQIKPLLLDQRFLAGIGNIYADEALFLARIHPRTPAASISRRKATILHQVIVETLSKAVDNAGTTFRDYRSAFGDPGSNQLFLNVYGAPSGTPCPRCGTRLRKLTVGQRGTTICPRCQRLR